MDLIPPNLNNNPEKSNIVPDIFALHRILQEVVDKHGLSPEDLISGTSRSNPITAARNEFCYRACVETKRLHSEIARIIEVSHTSIPYSAARFALRHDLPPPRGRWPAKVTKTRKSSYPKTLAEARLTQARSVRKERRLKDIDLHKEELRTLTFARRAREGSRNLLTLLRKHHSPPSG